MGSCLHISPALAPPTHPSHPRSQFGGQEPGAEAETEADVCSRVNATFPLTAKVEVGGANIHPLFAKLIAAKAPSGISGLMGSGIKWNFTKCVGAPPDVCEGGEGRALASAHPPGAPPPPRFLIDRNGNVVDRFGSMTTPAEIDAAVAKLL